ncbi:MAG: hydroxyethylthiazole kinase [Anaerovibrio sp.]|nr:hydroxyethylthiazole kinase [Anaerovibrio sp.]
MKALCKNDLLPVFSPLLNYIQQEAPLIHCITNPVSINDCANILLALGARPIMAEHPQEAAEIVSLAKALALNLGTITDGSMAAMLIAGRTAHEKNIPIIIDLVGVACSTLRMNFAQQLLQETRPDVIKGNISELRALLGLPVTEGMGVEAGQKEMVTAENAAEYAKIFTEKAREHHTVLLATGPIDLVVSEDSSFMLSNGTNALAAITGTGCMTNVLGAACLSAAHHLHRPAAEAGIMACLLLGIAAENIHQVFTDCGPGSFHAQLMDSISRLDAAALADRGRVQSISLANA